MKMGRRLQEEPDTIQMAPLIDIVFLTLVFFMTTTVFSTLESEIDIQLPTASAAAQSERSQGEIYINLRENGEIVVNNKVIELAELQEVLLRVAEYFPGGAVIIRGDNQAMLGRAIAVLDLCKNADIQNVSFAVVEEKESDGG